MTREQNVGRIDRIARGVVGVALLGLALGALLGGDPVAGVAAVLMGSGLLFDAATQHCTTKALVGVDACRG